MRNRESLPRFCLSPLKHLLRIVAFDRVLFEREFDRHCFAFTHRLSDHPLFQPERLRRLARYLAAADIPVEEVMQRLDVAQVWIVLRSAQKDPEYAKLLEGCMNEIVAMSVKDLGKVTPLSRRDRGGYLPGQLLAPPDRPDTNPAAPFGVPRFDQTKLFSACPESVGGVARRSAESVTNRLNNSLDLSRA